MPDTPWLDRLRDLPNSPDVTWADIRAWELYDALTGNDKINPAGDPWHGTDCKKVP
jgi:hypothetical protein